MSESSTERAAGTRGACVRPLLKGFRRKNGRSADQAEQPPGRPSKRGLHQFPDCESDVKQFFQLVAVGGVFRVFGKHDHELQAGLGGGDFACGGNGRHGGCQVTEPG